MGIYSLIQLHTAFPTIILSPFCPQYLGFAMPSEPNSLWVVLTKREPPLALSPGFYVFILLQHVINWMHILSAKPCAEHFT